MELDTIKKIETGISKMLCAKEEKELRNAFLKTVDECVICTGATTVILTKSNGLFSCRDGIFLRSKADTNILEIYNQYCQKDPYIMTIESHNGWFVSHDINYFSREMRKEHKVFSFFDSLGITDSISFNTEFDGKRCICGTVTRINGSETFSESDVEIIRILVMHLQKRLEQIGFASTINVEERLTEKEKAVFYLLIEGKMIKQISEILGITERTVKFHTGNIFTKCGVDSKAKLILKYKT